MAAKPVILVVEDSPLVRDTVVVNLTDEGYDVVSATDACELDQRLNTIKPDIILLDLMLPDGDGLSLIKNIRAQTDVPVIVISGKADMVDKVVGLEMGADDYIGKPLHMKEVAARVKAHLRRYKAMNARDATALSSHKSPLRVKFGDWILDCEKFQAYDKSAVSANLTIKEFKLLEILVLNANRVLSREQLLDQARDGEYNTTDRAVDVQILRIRKKIGDVSDPPALIKTIRGVGYTLVAKTEAFR